MPVYHALADLAQRRMRAKIPDLTLALEGRFGGHHALMCRLHLDHIDQLEAMIARLDEQVDAMMAPFHTERDLLTTIPGVGPLAAAGTATPTSSRSWSRLPGLPSAIPATCGPSTTGTS